MGTESIRKYNTVFYWVKSIVAVQKSHLSTTIKEPTAFVIKSPMLRFRRQNYLPPKRSPEYNPSYAFEPYWPDGGWVFERLRTTTEKVEGTVCGNECIDMYKNFGKICGRNKYYNRTTFSNYCELLDEDCSGRQKWMIAYRGACVSELKLYPTAQTEVLTRVVKYEHTFESINPEKFYYLSVSTNPLTTNKP